MFWFLLPRIERIPIESQRKHAKFSMLIYWLHATKSRSIRSNVSLASAWKPKLSCHFHLCNVHSKGLCAPFHRVLPLLSNAEREENGNMNQWSHFPSHIQPQAEMMSGFTSKTSLNDSNIWEAKIQRKPIFLKKCFCLFNRQHPYCKVWNKSRLYVIHGCHFGFHRMGKKLPKGYTLSCAEQFLKGIIRLVTFTLKICNFLLNHKKSYWSITAVISESSQPSLLNYESYKNIG